MHWLVTGAAGFIGSNLLLPLLQLGQRMRGQGNFLTGHRHNPSQIAQMAGPAAWRNFEFFDGDIRDPQKVHWYSQHQLAHQAEETVSGAGS